MAQKKASILDWALMNQQFQKLHNEHLIIMEKLSEIYAKVDRYQPLVIPELEKQIDRTSALALKIDRQVPDRNIHPLPPEKQPTQKGET